jgi:hypothetical protein
MTDNPYQSPATQAAPVPPGPSQRAAILRYLRVVQVCVVVIVVYQAVLLLRLTDMVAARDVLFAWLLALNGVATLATLVAVFATALLGTKLHGPIAGILLGVGVLVPVVQFLPLAWVLYRARSVLAQEDVSLPER